MLGTFKTNDRFVSYNFYGNSELFKIKFSAKTPTGLKKSLFSIMYYVGSGGDWHKITEL